MGEVTKDVLMEHLNTTRVEAINKFIEHISILKKDDVNDGYDILVGSAGKAVDHAIGSVLNLVYDIPSLFVESQELAPSLGTEVIIETTFKTGLAQQYWDHVSN